MTFRQPPWWTAEHTQPVLTPLGTDIWFTDNQVPLHTDGPTPKAVYALILLNEGGLVLEMDGKKKQYAMPIFSTHRILGHRLHGALKTPHWKPGRFAFLAWDVKEGEPNFASWPSFQDEALLHILRTYL